MFKGVRPARDGPRCHLDLLAHAGQMPGAFTLKVMEPVDPRPDPVVAGAFSPF